MSNGRRFQPARAAKTQNLKDQNHRLKELLGHAEGTIRGLAFRLAVAESAVDYEAPGFAEKVAESAARYTLAAFNEEDDQQDGSSLQPSL